MTAWTQRPEDEHRLLDALLRCFLRYDALPEELVIGTLAETGLVVPVTVALPPPEDRAFADVWSSLGGELKPSLDVVVIAPVTPGSSSGRAAGQRRASTAAVQRRRRRRRRDAPAHAHPPLPPDGRQCSDRSGDDDRRPAASRTCWAGVGVVEDRIRQLVAARRADDPQPDDPFRGLYLSDEMVDRLLDPSPACRRLVGRPPPGSTRLRAARRRGRGRRAPAPPPRPRRRRSASSPLDVDLLLVALAADLDPRFEQFFGYLNDDVTRRRPSVGRRARALRRAADARRAGTGAAHHGPLVSGGLVVVEDARPPASRAGRCGCPTGSSRHLLGDDTPIRRSTAAARHGRRRDWGDPSRLAAALAAGIRSIYLREPATGSGRVLAVEALRLVGLRRGAARPDRLGRAAGRGCGRPARSPRGAAARQPA